MPNAGVAPGRETDLVITLKGDASKEMSRLKNLTGLTERDLTEVGLTLLGIVADAPSLHQKVIVVSQKGRPLKEINLPRAS